MDPKTIMDKNIGVNKFLDKHFVWQKNVGQSICKSNKISGQNHFLDIIFFGQFFSDNKIFGDPYAVGEEYLK